MQSESKPSCRFSTSEYIDVRKNEFGNTALAEHRLKVLLHACCGPCATSCIERLSKDYSVTVFYYNPNITDEEEYVRRRDALVKFIEAYNYDNPSEYPISYVEGEYNPDAFIRKAINLKDEPEGGKRCAVCIEMRLAETARMARKLEMDYFTTSLTVSPHKNFEEISESGKRLAEGTPVEYLAIDFKKQNGFGRSVELSKKYDIYRQNFCGCDYSRRPADK